MPARLWRGKYRPCILNFRYMHIKISLPAACCLLLIGGAGCTYTTKTELLEQQKSAVQQESAEKNIYTTSQGLIVKNNEIFDPYVQNKKIGFIDGTKIHVYIEDAKEYSFIGSLGEGNMFSPQYTFDRGEEIKPKKILGATYNGITISTTYGGPYSIYKPVEQKDIRLACDGALVTHESKKDNDDIPYAYCTTNGKDSLEQFEYNGGDAFAYTTGGEVYVRWKKIYLKKLGDTIYIFSGELEQQPVELLDTSARQKNAMTTAYLDDLLKQSENKRRLAEWDTIVQSFDVQPL